MTASGHPSSGFSGVRRRIPRYSVAIPVDITVLRSGAPAIIPGRSLDLGEGGVAAVLAAELQLGEWVAMEFKLPNAAQAVQAKAVVRHHNQLRCGFEFLDLSGDQRSMIRRWAGNSKPIPIREPAALVSTSTPVATAAAAKLPAQVPAAPVLPSRRKAVAVPQQNRALDRLLRLTLVLVVVVGGWAAWQWHRGWQQLEASTARKDAHAQPPAARIPPDVMERLLIRRVDPDYPEAARRANLQGVVVLDAIISAEGTVVNLHPVGGPDALVAAAMDAARWWRFRPYRARGEPVAVETSLAVEVHP
jgi:TonB family protein